MAEPLIWQDDRWRHEIRSEGRPFRWKAQDTVSRTKEGGPVDPVDFGMVPGGIYAAVRSLVNYRNGDEQ